MKWVHMPENPLVLRRELATAHTDNGAEIELSQSNGHLICFVGVGGGEVREQYRLSFEELIGAVLEDEIKRLSDSCGEVLDDRKISPRVDELEGAK